MNNDSEYIVTNVSIIESIVHESHVQMTGLLEEGRTPKEDGGYILKFDPNHTSFKLALTVLVFVGAALEAMWHQKAVVLKSKTFAEKADRECKSVPLKYECIGLKDATLLHNMRHYYGVRREIVHEKAHTSKYQKLVSTAQTEADKAVDLLNSVKHALEQLNG